MTFMRMACVLTSIWDEFKDRNNDFWLKNCCYQEQNRVLKIEIIMII